MDKTQQFQTITEKLKDIRTAALTTIDGEGNFTSRPMGTQELEFDGTVWFMTHKDSDKAHHIEQHNKVGITYATGDNIKFVSMSGTAELLRDEAKINEFWNDFYKAWFDGPEDPNITLIKVTVERAEYWDSKGGKIGAYIAMAEGAITGEKGVSEKNDENEVFDLR